MNDTRFRRLVVGLAAIGIFGNTNSAQAKTFHCGPGDVTCLVAAIIEANANGHKKNTIRLAPGTYTLADVENVVDGANGLPSITSVLAIESTHKDTVILTRASDAPPFRLLHVGLYGRLSLIDIGLSNGNAHAEPEDPVNYGFGGALFNCGVVSIRNGTITNNHADSGGGGLYNCGTMTIERTAVQDNLSTGGGAGGISNTGDLTVADSTIAFNAAGIGGLSTEGGGVAIVRSRFTENRGLAGISGLFVAGGTTSITDTTFERNAARGPAIEVITSATLTIRDSAFVGNTGQGASAIANHGGSVEITNTTFTGNTHLLSFASVIFNGLGGQLILLNDTVVASEGLSTALSGSETTFVQNTIFSHPEDIQATDCAGPIVSLGNNLISDPAGCDITLQASDRTGDPGLDSFVDDGSPGNGHFTLLKTSQAIDAGNEAACPTRDQTGQWRKRQCDVGAIEFREKKHQRTK